MNCISLAHDLNIKQQQKNSGRGVTCVKNIIAALNQANVDEAIAIYKNDGDKICGVYTDLDQLICEGLNLEPRYSNCGWKRNPKVGGS